MGAVLNGALVGLCREINDSTGVRPHSSSTGCRPEALPILSILAQWQGTHSWWEQRVGTYLAFAFAECLGVGLVKTVDADAGLLYVLSPLPLSSLQRVNLLQVCHLHFACAHERLHMSCVRHTPYLVWFTM